MFYILTLEPTMRRSNSFLLSCSMLAHILISYRKYFALLCLQKTWKRWWVNEISKHHFVKSNGITEWVQSVVREEWADRWSVW